MERRFDKDKKFHGMCYIFHLNKGSNHPASVRITFLILFFSSAAQISICSSLSAKTIFFKVDVYFGEFGVKKG